jgi:hypothetical protein
MMDPATGPWAAAPEDRKIGSVGFGKDFTSPDIFVARCRCSSAII